MVLEEGLGKENLCVSGETDFDPPCTKNCRHQVMEEWRALRPTFELPYSPVANRSHIPSNMIGDCKRCWQ